MSGKTFFLLSRSDTYSTPSVREMQEKTGGLCENFQKLPPLNSKNIFLPAYLQNISGGSLTGHLYMSCPLFDVSFHPLYAEAQAGQSMADSTLQSSSLVNSRREWDCGALKGIERTKAQTSLGYHRINLNRLINALLSDSKKFYGWRRTRIKICPPETMLLIVSGGFFECVFSGR